MTAPVWVPSPGRVERANLTRFVAERRAASVDLPDYPALWRWSIHEPAEFWPAVWRFCGVVAEERDGALPWERVVVGQDRMAPPDPAQGPIWFPGARLNFAENLLRFDDSREAIVSWDEGGLVSRLSFAELRAQVARAAAALSAAGVRTGDRVAGYLPNLSEAVVAMLGAASLGAIWSSCSPDFGTDAVIDRFGQIEPRVLITSDGHRYAGKRISLVDRVRQLSEQLPSVERVVVIPYVGEPGAMDRIPGAVLWQDFLAPHADLAEPAFARLPFDHPLYIMYSSGTTGLPKCMVHGAGGTLLQHLKELSLHTDITRNDRVFYFTTCGWMMWNWVVSSLALGATLVLYDGAPLKPRATQLWDMAEAEQLTVFGTSAKYLGLAEKQGLVPARTHDLGALRTILSTGSPLAAHSYDYVYRDVKADVHLASISGGTDIISCFALGNPTAPVWRGELQTRGLGMDVRILRPTECGVAETASVGEPGELCCMTPFPSMPVRFWNDPDGRRYHDAYFAMFDNVWRHGDWAELTEHDGLIIHGRSDATLNPGGVRIGTAEIYRQVEQLPEVLESVVVGQQWGDDSRIVLFVRLRDDAVLDEALQERIRQQVRQETSPHHVPRRIVQVADIPRTISGKISEIAVREVIHGRPISNRDALANPASLELYCDLEELRS